MLYSDGTTAEIY